MKPCEFSHLAPFYRIKEVAYLLNPQHCKEIFTISIRYKLTLLMLFSRGPDKKSLSQKWDSACVAIRLPSRFFHCWMKFTIQFQMVKSLEK
jgi:hypothetical protein